MLLTALGHAGLRVTNGDATLLVDPWFNPEGAFLASWFQYPDNSHLLDDIALRRPEAVVITHEHSDHVDPWFLSTIDPAVTVVIPRYPSPVLRRKVLAGGDRPIVELDEWAMFEIDGFRLFFVAEPPMNHDSAVVVEAGGHTLVNLNDARPMPVRLREIRARLGDQVDMLTLQGAGASWYPMCYDYPEVRKRELSEAKRRAKLTYCARVVRTLEPAVTLPFAGPPVFLDPALVRHNAEMDGGCFPDQQQVADDLVARGVEGVEVLLPGDRWDPDARMRYPDAEWSGFSFDTREEYVVAYAARRSERIASVLERYPSPTVDLWPEFAAYFERLLAMSTYFSDRIGMRVGFEIVGPGGGAWAVDFRSGCRGVEATMGQCAYRYRFESRWLPPLLSGDLPWEDFLLSLRFEASRDPDRYNDHLLGLLKFADPIALAAVEQFEITMATRDDFEVHSDGRTYRVQRHCPHQGSDLLETGEVLPGGVLRCLAHHYEFDLATGECVNGNCVPLSFEPAHAPADISPAPPTSQCDAALDAAGDGTRPRLLR